MKEVKMKVGDLVHMYKRPNEKDWEGIGDIPLKIKLKENVTITEIHYSKSLKIRNSEGYIFGYYPLSCFKLTPEESKFKFLL